jgi:hypothetical protein
LGKSIRNLAQVFLQQLRRKPQRDPTFFQGFHHILAGTGKAK